VRSMRGRGYRARSGNCCIAALTVLSVTVPLADPRFAAISSRYKSR
jgi:hypothetical protein